MNELLKLGKYKNNFISRSSLANLLNDMGYNLKKVKRNKPLKKIEEPDAIFENVNKKKEEAMNDENTALISIDTKDKVIIGPYSRKSKTRIELVYYPPYHSKYNLIERLWIRLEMMWNGMLLTTRTICNKVMSQLTWKKVKAKEKYITKEYEKGITYSKKQWKSMKVLIYVEISN